jgi:hypothetical protein
MILVLRMVQGIKGGFPRRGNLLGRLGTLLLFPVDSIEENGVEQRRRDAEKRGQQNLCVSAPQRENECSFELKH